MSVTKEQVSSKFGVPVSNIEQIKSKQMFIITNSSGCYLISYLTIVGKYDVLKDKWLITNHKYSSTTSKQLTLFKRENPNHEVVEGVIVC